MNEIVKYDLDKDSIVRSTLKAKIFFMDGMRITLSMDDKVKVDIFNGYQTVKNADDINFADRSNYQYFKLNNWQMTRLVFYIGSRPTKAQIEANKSYFRPKEEESFLIEERIDRIRDIYKKTLGFYVNSVVKRKRYTPETLGGLGKVIVTGFKMCTTTGETLKAFFYRKQKCGYLSPKYNKKARPYFFLVLPIDLDKDKWRADAVNPKVSAHEFFMKELDKSGFSTKGLRIKVLDIDSVI